MFQKVGVLFQGTDLDQLELHRDRIDDPIGAITERNTEWLIEVRTQRASCQRGNRGRVATRRAAGPSGALGFGDHFARTDKVMEVNLLGEKLVGSGGLEPPTNRL